MGEVCSLLGLALSLSHGAGKRCSESSATYHTVGQYRTSTFFNIFPFLFFLFFFLISFFPTLAFYFYWYRAAIQYRTLPSIFLFLSLPFSQPPPPSIFAPSTAKPESIHTTHPQPTTLLVHAPNTITSILQYHHYHHHHHHHHHLQHNSTSDNDTASPTPVLRTILLPDLSSYSLHFPLDTNLSPLKLLTHRNP